MMLELCVLRSFSELFKALIITAVFGNYDYFETQTLVWL